MFKVNLQYHWQPQPDKGFPVDATLFRVLFAVNEVGSIAGAAKAVGMSYRHVWGLMRKWEKAFGKPLVDMQQGRGAALTEFGRKLLWAEELVRARLTPGLESVRQEVEQVLSQAIDASPSRIAICASHDLALAALRDRMAHRDGLKLDIRFKGSLESLEGFSRGRCALAGFHLAEGLAPATAAAFRRHLGAQHRVIGLATRTQGLMVKRGNAAQIHSLFDLTRPGVRFVNRQQGSGSRIEFDHLLAGAGIEAGDIDGYLNEEHTHLAVAATVAGGMADAGFGIKAAAAQYELDFIPLLTERYYLACGADALRSAEFVEFLAILRGEVFRAILGSLAGYGDGITGRLFRVEDVFAPRGGARASSPAISA